MTSGMQHVAHRGGSRLAPENTLAAFRNALTLPIDAIELDVQMSSDGQLIVFHDNSVERLTDGTGNILDLDFATLRSLNAAAHFSGGWPEPQKMPTLNEVLSLVKREVDGIVLWSYSMEPQRDENGSFVTWSRVSDPSPGVTRMIEAWVVRYFGDFMGVVNFETIDEAIIEAPPRMAVQFIDFYGRDWLDAVVRLCSQGTWLDPSPAAPEGVSYVLRLPASAADSHPRLVNRMRVIELERETDTSIYLPWQNGQRLGDSNDDDASFRLAIVNASSLQTAQSVAAELLSYIEGLDMPSAGNRSHERAVHVVHA